MSNTQKMDKLWDQLYEAQKSYNKYRCTQLQYEINKLEQEIEQQEMEAYNEV